MRDYVLTAAVVISAGGPGSLTPRPPVCRALPVFVFWMVKRSIRICDGDGVEVEVITCV